jgi:uncharacterized protein
MMPLANWLGMAATSLVAALLLATNGFGFAVLAAPFFLLLVPPAVAIQVTIILALAISIWVLPGVRHSIEWPLLLRLSVGGIIGLPLGLAGFAYAEPIAIRAVAGAVIAAFAGAQAYSRYHQRPPSLAMHPVGDFAAGAAAGAATGLIGMPGPPLVIYLILVGAPAQLSRATQIAFFALVFAATLAANAALRGVPGIDWAIAASLMPTTGFGAWLGMHVGNRLDGNAATVLAIAVLGATGLYTLAFAIAATLW